MEVELHGFLTLYWSKRSVPDPGCFSFPKHKLGDTRSRPGRSEITEKPKVIILEWYGSHNTGLYNLSTTCFGQCCCGHHQVGYNVSGKLYKYNTEQILVLV